jgi:hypothetical protein
VEHLAVLVAGRTVVRRGTDVQREFVVMATGDERGEGDAGQVVAEHAVVPDEGGESGFPESR